MKQKFNIITSTCVPLPLENVDTDQIIPARFLKATDKEGFGDNLFRDWRYNKDGSPKKDFVLNDPTYGPLAQAQVVSMQHGQLQGMDLGLLSAVSSLIYTRIMS